MYTLSQFQALAANHDFITSEEFEVANTKLIKFGYNYCTSTDFKNEILKECRGITFLKSTGELVGLPFPKFFNINETEPTLFKKLEHKKIIYASNKLDGSMVFPIVINDVIYMCTKMAFAHPVAIRASEIANEELDYKNFILAANKLNITPIFEYTSPDNQIVLPYQTENLSLIGLRSMQDGKLIPLTDYKEALQVPNTFIRKGVSLAGLIEENKLANMKEGDVVLFEDLTQVKVKTPWYTINHRFFTQMRIRDIALSVLTGNSDDVLSIIRTLGRSERLEAYEKGLLIVHSEIDKINERIKMLANHIKAEENPRDAYEKYGREADFKAATYYIQGKLDLHSYIKRKYLKQFTLEEIF